MSNGDDRLTRNIAIPAWMVYVVSGLVVVLSGTIGGVIVQDRGQMHTLGNDLGTFKSEVRDRLARFEEKQKDILDAINSLREDMKP